ncbi:hypothetical protein Cgig2_026991 [Carnegiea gigantea]|uniref:Uncharacterized protein n=1 Tax=Carnegiea gigantea TaxID=171969 RepID=A0A9Q1GJF8_9CARY|nr:hypothetical protein Cgig2_026991 [Carnegiea gigantea]
MSWTKGSLTSGSVLIKLIDGRVGKEEAAPATTVGVPAALEIVGCPGRAGVLLSSLRGEGAEAPVLSGYSLVLCFLLTGKLTAGLFLRGVREGAYRKEFSLSPNEKPREEKQGLYNIPFWLAGPRKAASPPLVYARQQLPLVHGWHPRSQTLSAEPSLDLHKTNRKSVLKRLNTLSDILKNEKAGCSEEEVVHKELQSREPVEWLSIARPGPSLLRPLCRFNCLGHEPWNRPRPTVLTYVEHEISGRAPFLCCRLPKGASNWFPLIPIRNITPT